MASASENFSTLGWSVGMIGRSPLPCSSRSRRSLSLSIAANKAAVVEECRSLLGFMQVDVIDDANYGGVDSGTGAAGRRG